MQSEPVLIPIHESAAIADGMTLEVLSFTHKHPMPKGPTKASAQIMLKQGDESLETELSVRGRLGTDVENFGSIQFGGWMIQLVEFDYGTSITVSLSPAASED